MEIKRQTFLDIAKGIGIIFVLFSHSCGFPIFGHAIVNFYMPLFFVISGYVYRPGRSLKENIKRKAKQLLVPYFGYTALLYLEHIFFCIVKNDLTKKNIFMPIIGALYSRAALYVEINDDNIYFLLISNGVMWFLTAMMLASVVYYCFVEMFLKDIKKRLGISVGLVLATMVLSYCPYLLPWSIDVVPVCAWFMLLGAYLGKKDYFSSKGKSLQGIGLIVLLAFIYGIITEYMQPINLSLRDFGYEGWVGVVWLVLVSLSGTIIFLWICKYLEEVSWMQWLSKVGRHTLSIMSLHILLFKYSVKFYYLFHMQFPFERTCIWYWIYWIISFVIIILFCIAFDTIISKIKDNYFRRS